jgi:bifunctional UDP-N-acetylglucosamine pyrophosphorylase / glucosamine-1-phosphate N-acetyltransferase
LSDCLFEMRRCDVADGELRMVRAEQAVKPGWADRFHDAMRKKKAEAAKK